MEHKQLSFSVDSQLLGELGERLVTKNYIALAELVKNAFDAESPCVLIKFVNLKKDVKPGKSSEIQIIDKGHGMTLSNIQDFFMRVATANKLRTPLTQNYGRIKTGSKGIGRFACRKLAKKLIIETNAKNEKTKKYEHTIVEFDWSIFKRDTDLTTIILDAQTETTNETHTGTTLRLIDLAETWSDYEFLLLKRQILSLCTMGRIKRKGYKEDPGFEIFFKAPGFSEGDGKLDESIIDGGWGTLTGEILDDGTAKLHLDATEIGSLTYPLPKKFKKIKGITFKIAWIPINREYYRKPELLTQTNMKKFVKTYGGIRVYLDDFRIFPYGVKGDDWLGFDRDVAKRRGSVDPLLANLSTQFGFDASRVMLNLPGSESFLGSIYISSVKTTGFEIKLNREGFVENEQFLQLVDVVQLSVQWMVIHYNRFLSQYSRRKQDDSKNELVKTAESLNKNEGFKEIPFKLSDLSAPTPTSSLKALSTSAISAFSSYPQKEREQYTKIVEKLTDYVEYSFEHYTSVLGAVASTGAMIFVFAHEIKSVIAKLDSEANRIENMLDNVPSKERQKLIELMESLRVTRDRLDKNIEIFSLLTKKATDTQNKEINLNKTAYEVVDSFGYLIEHYNLNKPKIDIPDELRTKPMLDAEIYSIFVNLLSNAIKANIAGDGRNVLISSRKEHGKLFIRFYDDGIGLSQENWERVFNPMTSDPEGKLYKGLQEKIVDKDLAALGMGTGLGLTIVKNIMDKYKGKIQFIPVKQPWKTCIEVEFY
jgi:signal transduction histidine kinase